MFSTQTEQSSTREPGGGHLHRMHPLWLYAYALTLK